MIIELGNTNPHAIVNGAAVPFDGPAVTTMLFDDVKREDGSYFVGFAGGIDPIDALRQFALHRGGVMHFGGNELVHQVIEGWDGQSEQPPSWIQVDPEDRDPDNAKAAEAFFASYWGCSVGKPADVEETHYTQHGARTYAPGEVPVDEPVGE